MLVYFCRRGGRYYMMVYFWSLVDGTFWNLVSVSFWSLVDGTFWSLVSVSFVCFLWLSDLNIVNFLGGPTSIMLIFLVAIRPQYC